MANDTDAVLLTTVQVAGATRTQTITAPSLSVDEGVRFNDAGTSSELATALARLPDGTWFSLSATGTRDAGLGSPLTQAQHNGGYLRRGLGTEQRRLVANSNITTSTELLLPTRLAVSGNEVVVMATGRGSVTFPGGPGGAFSLANTPVSSVWASYESSATSRTSATIFGCATGTGDVRLLAGAGLSDLHACALFGTTCSSPVLRVSAFDSSMSESVSVPNGTSLLCGLLGGDAGVDDGGAYFVSHLSSSVQHDAGLVIAGGTPIAWFPTSGGSLTAVNVVTGAKTTTSLPIGSRPVHASAASGGIWLAVDSSLTADSVRFFPATLSDAGAAVFFSNTAAAIALVAATPAGDVWIAGTFSGASAILDGALPADAGTFLLRLSP